MSIKKYQNTAVYKDYRSMSKQERLDVFEHQRRQVVKIFDAVLLLCLLILCFSSGAIWVTLTSELVIIGKVLVLLMFGAIAFASIRHSVAIQSKVINPIKNATGYTDVAPEVFKLMGGMISRQSPEQTQSQYNLELSAFIIRAAAEYDMIMEEQDAEHRQRMQSDADHFELVTTGQKMGTIDGHDILEHLIIQDRRTGQQYTLKYVSYSATDPVAEFRRIAEVDEIGYIYNNVIYMARD
jgi:hypothetical protein